MPVASTGPATTVNRDVRHLLLVGGARDVTPTLRELRGGLTITTMVAVERLGKVRHPQHCARVLALEGGAPPEEWVALARAVHALDPVHAVAALGEFDQDKAAAVAVDLGLPFHPREVLDRVYDKHLMRGRLRAAGVDDTPSAVVSSLDDLAAFTAAHGLPAILKPVAGTGSRGLVKLTGDEALADGSSTRWASATVPHTRS